MKSFLLLCLLLPLALGAATWRVNNAPEAAPDYTTIQDAIDAAADGDTILIEGSTAPYSGFLIVNKRLSLIGPGYALPANLGTPANKLGAVIQGGYSHVRTMSGSPGSANGTLVMGLEFVSELQLIGCTNVTVSRCLFNTSANGRIHLSGPNNLVSQCFFSGSSQPVYLYSNSSGARIENCLMPQSYFSTSGPPATLLYLRNNLLQSLGESSSTTVVADNNIFLDSFSVQPTSTYRNNLFLSSVPFSINGSGNLGDVSLSTVMPAFQNAFASFDARYKIGPAVAFTGAPNPAFNAGTDGTHIGPFGGANPYILSGIPPLPTIDELSVPQFAAPGAPLTIRVKVSERP